MNLIRFKESCKLNKNDKLELQRNITRIGGLQVVNEMIKEKGYYHTLLQSSLKEVFITSEGMQVCK